MGEREEGRERERERRKDERVKEEGERGESEGRKVYLAQFLPKCYWLKILD